MQLLTYFASAAFLVTPNLGDLGQRVLISLVSVFFVLGVLVFVHEFGHYAMAKLFGVRVEVFSLGFGKRLGGSGVARPTIASAPSLWAVM